MLDEQRYKPGVMGWRVKVRSVLLCSLFWGVSGCAKKESIVVAGGDHHLSASEIDGDPLALLPGGPVGVGYLNVTACLTSSLGAAVQRASQRLIPLTPEMNFEPSRDLKKLTIAVYSLQGADVAAVAQGTFNAAAIEQAVARKAVTAFGQPLQKAEYAGNTLYLSGDVGLVLLTPQTALVGNPAGVRRALERLRDGRIRREIPDWANDVLQAPGGQVAVAADFTNQPLAQEVVRQAKFLNGLRTLRLVGTFESGGGLNLAGSVSYPDEASAASANEQVRAVGQLTTLLSLFGGSSLLRSLQTTVREKDLQFTVILDGQSLGRMLEMANYGSH